MSLCLLRYAELDHVAWDTCVAEAEEDVVYAYSWWLQATAGSWDAVVEIQEPTGRYLSILPLPIKSRPWGRQVVQPLFTQQLGLLTTSASQHTSIHPYLAVASRAGYSSFYSQFHTAIALVEAPVGFQLTTRLTYHLPLAPTYTQLHAAYDPNCRRRLRQNAAAVEPLYVTRATDARPLLELFQQTKGPEAGLSRRHYRRLRQLIISLQRRQLLELWEVRQPSSGDLLAGALFVRYRTQLIYLFAAASAEGKQRNAPTLLLDNTIRLNAGTSNLILDFEGGMIPSIARFFANFGAVPVPYVALSFTQRPWYLKWTR